MLFTVDGKMNIQMKALSCYGSVTGGRFFVNIRQSYINNGGEGVAAFRFILPEKSFINKLEITTPEKSISTEYITATQAQTLKEGMPSGSSPITLDENGIFTAVIGVIKPQHAIEISFTYVQEVSVFSSIKITLPIRTTERLAEDFTLEAKIKWQRAKGIITAVGTHIFNVEDNIAVLQKGYMPDKDITLELRAQEVSQCCIYKGKLHSLLETKLNFEPLRRQHAHEYLFVIDTSRTVKPQWDNIKNALLSCICALNENEFFNIITFGLSPKLLSIGGIKATDSSKASAKLWLDDIAPAGSSDIGEALNFAWDICSRRTEVFLVTNSRFVNSDKIISEATGRAYSSLNVISGNKEYTEAAQKLAQAGGGIAEDIVCPVDLADGLCKALSRNLLTGAGQLTLKTDKASVWHMENSGMIYPWDTLSVFTDSVALLPEYAEISAKTDTDLNVRYTTDVYTKGADLLCDIHSARYSDNSPETRRELSMTVETAGRTMHFAATNAEGGGSDKPNNVRKNALAFLAMQSTDGSIGSPSETTGRLWEIMTTHPTPSVFMLQIKKAVEFLLDFVHFGDYDVLPERLLDVFELWLEMFPSDTVFAKKIEALVYMNRK